MGRLSGPRASPYQEVSAHVSQWRVRLTARTPLLLSWTIHLRHLMRPPAGMSSTTLCAETSLKAEHALCRSKLETHVLICLTALFYCQKEGSLRMGSPLR